MKSVANATTLSQTTRTSPILKNKWRRQFLSRIHARNMEFIDKEDQRTCAEDKS